MIFFKGDSGLVDSGCGGEGVDGDSNLYGEVVFVLGGDDSDGDGDGTYYCFCDGGTQENVDSGNGYGDDIAIAMVIMKVIDAVLVAGENVVVVW